MNKHNEDIFIPFSNEEFVIVSPFKTSEENRKALETAQISKEHMACELELLKICDEKYI